MNNRVIAILAAVTALAMLMPAANADVDCTDLNWVNKDVAVPCVQEMIEQYGDGIELRAADQAAEHAADQYMPMDAVNAGFAMSAAMSAIPFASGNSVGFGVGTSGGQQAFAVGVSASVDELLSVRATVATDTAGQHTAVGFGAAIQF